MSRILKSFIRRECRRRLSRDLRGPCDKLQMPHVCIHMVLAFAFKVYVASSDITLKHDVMNVHYKSGTFPVWGPRRRVDTHLRDAIFNSSLS